MLSTLLEKLGSVVNFIRSRTPLGILKRTTYTSVAWSAPHWSGQVVLHKTTACPFNYCFSSSETSLLSLKHLVQELTLVNRDFEVMEREWSGPATAACTGLSLIDIEFRSSLRHCFSIYIPVPLFAARLRFRDDMNPSCNIILELFPEGILFISAFICSFFPKGQWWLLCPCLFNIYS